MKHVKTYNTEDRQMLMDECVNLFKKLWSEKIQFYHLVIVPEEPNNYNLFFVTSLHITKKTYGNYREFFDFIDKFDFHWTFTNRLDLYINDIQAFINEMKILLDAKKYNL